MEKAAAVRAITQFEIEITTLSQTDGTSVGLIESMRYNSSRRELLSFDWVYQVFRSSNKWWTRPSCHASNAAYYAAFISMALCYLKTTARCPPPSIKVPRRHSKWLLLFNDVRVESIRRNFRVSTTSWIFEGSYRGGEFFTT